MPTDTTPKSPEPPAGSPPVDLEARLAQLTADLQKSKDSEAEAQRKLQQKEGEAKLHQRERDRLTRLVRNPNPSPPPTPNTSTQDKAPARVPPQPAPTANRKYDELADFANEQARQLYLYEQILARGLALSDVEGIEFETPGELDLKLDALELKNKVVALEQTLKGQAESQKPSPGLIDTGGPTGVEAPDKQVQEAWKRAADLKKQGKHQEATWIALRAAKNPVNIITRE